MNDFLLMRKCIADAGRIVQLDYPEVQGMEHVDNVMNAEVLIAVALFNHRVRHLSGNPLCHESSTQPARPLDQSSRS